MKKLVILFFVFGVFTISAQEHSDFKSETISFLRRTISKDNFVTVVAQLSTSVPDGKKEAYVKEAKGTLDGLYERMADVYMKEFTREEMAQLNQFYATDLGKKLSTKQFGISQQINTIGQNWALELKEIAKRHL